MTELTACTLLLYLLQTVSGMGIPRLHSLGAVLTGDAVGDSASPATGGHVPGLNRSERGVLVIACLTQKR